MEQLPPTMPLSVSIRRLEDTLPSLRLSGQPSSVWSSFPPTSKEATAMLSPLPSTSKGTAGCENVVTKAEVDSNDSKQTDLLNTFIEFEEPPKKRNRTMPNRYGFPPVKREKSPLKQVAFSRKIPTKNTYSNDASNKTIKKYRDSAARSPEKKMPISPRKHRVAPKRKIKSELERLTTPFYTQPRRPAQESVHELKPIIPAAPPEAKEQDEDNQVQQWLASNEADDVKPIRAAAIEAAKKGQLGVIKSKPKKETPQPRIRPRINRKDRITKGKSRRTIIMKKSRVPRPIRDQVNDNAITFHKSIICDGTYFQIGDIVSINDSKGGRLYYLQIQHLITDEYYREGAGMRWLVPRTPDALKQPFEPKNFKLCSSSEKEVKRWLTDVNLVAHCPLDYYDEEKDKDVLYQQAVNGTIYIRFNRSKEIMTFVVPDIPEIRRHNEMVNSRTTSQSESKENPEPVFKVPNTALIPWIEGPPLAQPGYEKALMETTQKVEEDKSDPRSLIRESTSTPTVDERVEMEVNDADEEAESRPPNQTLLPLKSISSESNNAGKSDPETEKEEPEFKLPEKRPPSYRNNLVSETEVMKF